MKNNLKIIISLALALATAFGLAPLCLAADVERYEIESLNMTVELPQGYAAATRDSQEDARFFQVSGADYKDAMSYFKSSGIYLQAITQNGSTLTLTAERNESSAAIVSYSSLSGGELEILKASFEENEIYTSAAVEKLGGHKFLALSFTQTLDGQKINGVQYNTVENGTNINLTLTGGSEPLDKELLREVRGVAESLRFTKISEQVSAFSLPKIIFTVIGVMFALALIIAAVFYLVLRFRGVNMLKSGATNGGFDSRENSRFYGYLAKKRAERKEKERKKRRDRRSAIADNIENGESYDVFSDK